VPSNLAKYPAAERGVSFQCEFTESFGTIGCPKLALFLLGGVHDLLCRGIGLDHLFCCEICGSTAVTLPRDLHVLSEVMCACCGGFIGTLGELRARAERLAPVAGRQRSEATSYSLTRL
jgi:hypothetical protein